MAIAIGACAAAPPPSPVVLRRLTGVVSYSSPAECFWSTIAVTPNHDFHYGGDEFDDLTFRYKAADKRGYVPIAVGQVIASAPHRSYELCVVPITIDDELVLNLIEVGMGTTLLWNDTDDFPVEQKLAWSADRRDLLVELGRAMDEVPVTPLHGAGVVQVAAPDAVRALPAELDYKLVVHIDSRRGGATVELVEVDALDNSMWKPIWTAVRPSARHAAL